MSLKLQAERAAHALGAGYVLRRVHGSDARILMYHRFPGTPSDVRAGLAPQCEHLRRFYHPIGLAEVAKALCAGEKLPPRSVALTVDDGYADFAHAFPVFQAYGLPVTLYVVSGFASRELWLWPDRVQYLLDHTTAQSVTVPLPGESAAVLDISTAEGRSHAFQAICQPLIRASNSARLQALEAMPALFGIEMPVEIPAEAEPLSWEELRVMAAQSLDVGCHTRTHPILSRVESESGLRDEIAGAKHRIEEMLQRPVSHFCYPNGQPPDFNAACVGAVKAAGFLTAVSTESGLVSRGADVLRLPRLGVEPGWPALLFERTVAGYRAGDR